MPSPICFQSLTLFLCSSNGCNSNPSSNTSFKALIATLTALLNSGILNAALSVNGFSTNSLKFNAPNKQLPPAGKGSSSLLSQRLFILYLLQFPVSSAYIFTLMSVGGSWRDYCFHLNAHPLCSTDSIRYYYPRYYHILL